VSKDILIPARRTVVWWDDQLIEEKDHGSSRGNARLWARAISIVPVMVVLILGEKLPNWISNFNGLVK